MPRVKIVGTLKSPTSFEVFGHEIPISKVSPSKVGERLELEGYLCFREESGSYFQVVTYKPSEEKDKNECTITGKVVGILPTRKHPTHGKTAGVIIQQSLNRTSRVLVTVVGSRIKDLDVGNLSTGQELGVKGYINYHSRGLHVTYKEKADIVDQGGAVAVES